MTESATVIDPATPVGDLVLGRPGRARAFEQFGIDYCCGGRRSLQQACQSAAVDVSEVVATLDESDAADDSEPDEAWEQLGLAALAAHIVETHHVYLHEELPRIVQLADRVADAHGSRHPEMVELAKVVAAESVQLELHLGKEESILFPICSRLEQGAKIPEGGLDGPLGVMAQDHDSTAASLERIRELTHDFVAPEDACPTWHALLDALRRLDSDTRIHIHKESNALYPCMEAQLGD